MRAVVIHALVLSSLENCSKSENGTELKFNLIAPIEYPKAF